MDSDERQADAPTAGGSGTGTGRAQTHATYKRTFAEALSCENRTPYHEMFDLDSGELKEKYRRPRSPSPPAGTVVYEVGTGREFTYTPEARPRGVHPDAGTLEDLREAASRAAVLGTTGLLPVQIRPVADDTCCCIALVNLANVGPCISTPEFTIRDDYNLEIGEGGELAARSPTLRYLRIGYRNYMTDQVNDTDTHKLSSFRCRSLVERLFRLYKAVTCRTGVSRPLSGQHSPCETGLEGVSYRLMSVIHQYVSAFSVICDFTFTLPAPQLRGGVCSVLVVNKVWLYSSSRKLFVPVYLLMYDDEYTKLALAEMRRETNRGRPLRYVRFISNCFTPMYTNRPSLETRGGERPAGSTDVEEYALKPRGWPAHEHQPRSDVLGHSAPKERPVPEDRRGPCTRSEDVSHQCLDPARVTAASRPAMKNPTLIVYQSCLNDRLPDTFLCTIIAEIHLGDGIRY